MVSLAYIYFAAVALLSIYGLHRSTMMAQVRLKGLPQRPQRLLAHHHPPVCVQLPIYNESKVVERLLRAVAALDYPKDLVRIQVLDDSTDDTVSVIDRVAAELVSAGHKVEVLRRGHRSGFKAGALAYGLEHCDEEFVAVFDADFVPPSDFLLRTIPHFSDQTVGFVQCRWTHLNRNYNRLTRAQAVLIDAHFLIEHAARASARVFFNFNGTAGVWRRAAIAASGGWQGDTITEDLDLSYRAQMVGWRGVFMPEVECPAELPETVSAFKSQQYRWTKGSAQVLRKLLWPILISKLSIRTKLEAFFHLSAHFCYPLMVLIAFLLVPVASWRARVYFSINPWFELFVFVCTLISMGTFYCYGQWLARRRVPVLDVLAGVTLGVGISFHCAAAALSGLLSSRGEFVRTPKRGSEQRSMHESPFSTSFDWGALRGNRVELALFLYLIAGVVHLLLNQNVLTVPFVLLIVSGYWVLLSSVLTQRDPS